MNEKLMESLAKICTGAGVAWNLETEPDRWRFTAEAAAQRPAITRKPRPETADTADDEPRKGGRPPADPRHHEIMTGIIDAIRKGTGHAATLENGVAVGKAVKAVLRHEQNKTAAEILEELAQAARFSCSDEARYDPALRRGQPQAAPPRLPRAREPVRPGEVASSPHRWPSRQPAGLPCGCSHVRRRVRR